MFETSGSPGKLKNFMKEYHNFCKTLTINIKMLLDLFLSEIFFDFGAKCDLEI